MKALKEEIAGRLLVSEDAAALVLDRDAGHVFLRYALVSLETEEHFFPEVLLDDWGHEIKKLALYAWLRENGWRFPRAEIFGWDLNGSRSQFFLRELDLASKYPSYGFVADAQDSLANGHLVRAVIVIDDEAPHLERIKRPASVKPPLSDSRVGWWRISRKQMAAEAIAPYKLLVDITD